MSLTISVLADRPDLLEAFHDMENPWPEFMRQDPIGAMYYCPETVERFSEHILVCQDESSDVVAKAYSIPLFLESSELPDDGWEGAIRQGLITSMVGQKPNLLCALEIVIKPGLRGRGWSSQILVALRDNAARHGFSELVVPVRPNGKDDIYVTMDAYSTRTRDDGLPVDPWLRVHVRAGGVIDKVAHRALVIPGTTSEWREWTGLPFDRSGPVDVPGALSPVLCDAEHGTAVYVEPNVWVRHRTGSQ